MKSKKKIADRTQHSQNCNLFADGRFCKRCSEAKNARGCSHRLFLKGTWSEHRAKRTSNGATGATKNHKNGYYRGRLGVKKVRFLMQEAWKLFKKCARHRGREALFEKSHQILEEKGAMSKASRHGRAEVHEMHTQERPRTGNACFSNGICKFLMAISVPNLAFFR